MSAIQNCLPNSNNVSDNVSDMRQSALSINEIIFMFKAAAVSGAWFPSDGIRKKFNTSDLSFLHSFEN